MRPMRKALMLGLDALAWDPYLGARTWHDRGRNRGLQRGWAAFRSL